MGDRNDSKNRDSCDMCGQSGGDSFLDLELESEVCRAEEIPAVRKKTAVWPEVGAGEGGSRT